MTEIEAIRDALTAIADEAPAPERVRATMSDRARAHRQRRVLLSAGGLVAAGAAAGFTGYVATTRERRDPRPAGPTGGWLRVPYAYGPAWLPDRLGLYDLQAIVDRDEVRQVSRVWQLPGAVDAPLGPSVGLIVGNRWSGEGDYDGAKTFDINGVEGKFKIRAFRLPADLSRPAEVERRGDLAWDPPDAPPLLLSYAGDGSYEEDDPAVRVARSIRLDRGSFVLHPRFGWLPDRFVDGPLVIRIGVRTGGWFQEVTAYPADGGDRGVTVQMGTVEPHTSRWEVPMSQSVRGIEGQYQNGFLRFVLPDDVKVSVFGLDEGVVDNAPPPPDLLRIIEEFEFGDWPDTSWAGSR